MLSNPKQILDGKMFRRCSQKWKGSGHSLVCLRRYKFMERLAEGGRMKDEGGNAGFFFVEMNPVVPLGLGPALAMIRALKRPGYSQETPSAFTEVGSSQERV